MGFSAATISYIEIASAVAAAAGTAVSVYASVEQGEQRKAEADFNARVADNNASYAEDEAQQRAANIRKAARASQAEVNASLAGSGVKLGEGTPIDINRTIYQQSEIDAANAILTGKRNADGSTNQATLLRSAGSNASENGYIGAGATILGAASKAYQSTGWRTQAPKPKAGTGSENYYSGP